MKTIILMFLLSFPLYFNAQNSFPDVTLRNLDGECFSTSEIFNTNHPQVMIFWKSFDTKCCSNLENMQSAWLSQLKDRGVNLVAICIDCKGNWSYLKPIISGKAWEFDIFIDSNGDLKRALGVTNAPYTLLFDEENRVICRHEGYCSGNEDLVCKKILDCLFKTDHPLAQKVK
jgi:peroxiredoxin